MSIKTVEVFLTEHQILIEVGTALGAVVFAMWQISVNRKIRSLQDFVSIAVVPGEGRIKLLNTGKSNLYLRGFEMPGRRRKFSEGKERLITAGTGDESYYWLPLPTTVRHGENFKGRLYLIDEFKRKWVAPWGGTSEKLDNDNVQIMVWTHQIQRQTRFRMLTQLIKLKWKARKAVFKRLLALAVGFVVGFVVWFMTGKT